ncbi:hypothetical protein TWF506_010704 [Arthrobotrys conoides]|uniref:Uncharacterized protein n=1 Tax=Arthrobotrys conoides TaxID=74498 RepID=A0AAN8RVZ4_9PEZI
MCFRIYPSTRMSDTRLLFTIIYFFLIIPPTVFASKSSGNQRKGLENLAIKNNKPINKPFQSTPHSTLPSTPKVSYNAEQIESPPLKRPRRRYKSPISPQTFPGPTKATPVLTTLSGTPTKIHTWIAATEPLGVLTTYTVSTPSPKPTLVYNCNIVPALCNAAEKHLGVGVVTTTLIYDRWKSGRVDGVKVAGRTRVDERRRYACGNGRRLLSVEEQRGVLKCPAVEGVFGGEKQKVQPGEFTVQSKIVITTEVGREVVVLTTYTPAVFPGNIIMTNTYEVVGAVGTKTLRNQMAVETEVDGVMVRKGISYKFSCEEFPPATSIQGGLGAETYCVPIRQPMGFATEQNWQGSAIAGLRIYAQKSIHGFNLQQKNNYTTTNTLFEYDFEMRYSNGHGAVWVEGGGEVEYCYGPWGPNPKDCQGIQDTVRMEPDEGLGTELQIKAGIINHEVDLEVGSMNEEGISITMEGSLKNTGGLDLNPEIEILGKWDFGISIGPEGS